MTIQKKLRKASRLDKRLWFERLMAIAALTNLSLVAFDLSYITWRDFYLQKLPSFTQWYGANFKGIEPYRSTDLYLQTASALETEISQTGVQSPRVLSLLEQLRNQSTEMIEEDPFQTANKSGTLERIKRRMRQYTGQESSKQAFETFWSPAYVSQTNWNASSTFFNRQIAPLIRTNYYRGIGENGAPIDLFLKIDLVFLGLFGIELLARTFALSRIDKVTWFDALLWRWYDLLLLLPFWRSLRIIPVLVRLNQAKLINLKPLSDRLTKGLVTSLAVELTEVVILRAIDQVQALIRQGEITRWLLHSSSGQRYIDLNNIDEGKAIAQHLVTLLVYQVLPQVKPDLEAFMHHTLTRVLSASPAYSGLERLPGIGNWSNQLTQQFVSQVSQNTYQALIAALEDPVGIDLLQRIVDRFGHSLKTQAQQGASEEIQALLVEMLEEFKINYVKRLTEADPEILKADLKKLYGMTLRE
ncbi:MAG: hypothetical protein KME11_19735 [Timaviella obliquedivisa GSE-PSE-MK23-08B]|jgi:hypothetical protein|nr:hypothetical protein [Timaviella obliquedivisa GSE-PSE-MK23-08B]